MRRGRYHGRHARRRSHPKARAAIAGTGAVSVCAGIAIAAHLGVFFLHSSAAGGALVGAERKAIAKTAGQSRACLAPRGGTARGTAGLLEAPVLGLVAPVRQGTSDAVLSDAVGHDPASAWPGQAGTSVLSAHDVTWFSHLPRLRPGDRIRYVTPCWTYTYTVTSHAVVAAGSPVYATGTARLVLETCYPLDALYFTSRRYLVYADMASSSPTHATAAVPRGWPVPAVPAPAQLAAQGLGLTGNHALLGALHLAGSPSRAWIQSDAPLRFEAAAFAGYFGITRSAAQGERAWWSALAPSVPVSAAGPLWNGHIASYDSDLQITLRAESTRAAGAVLAATVSVSGAGGEGRYDLTVREKSSHGKLYVTRVRLTPAG